MTKHYARHICLISWGDIFWTTLYVSLPSSELQFCFGVSIRSAGNTSSVFSPSSSLSWSSPTWRTAWRRPPRWSDGLPNVFKVEITKPCLNYLLFSLVWISYDGASSSPGQTHTWCSAPAPPSLRRTAQSFSSIPVTLEMTCNHGVNLYFYYYTYINLDPKEVRTPLLLSWGFWTSSRVSSGWMSAALVLFTFFWYSRLCGSVLKTQHLWC